MTTKVTPLLAQHCKPLEPYFRRKDIVEICVNQPGEIWLETMKGWEVVKDKAITKRLIDNFAGVLATVKGQAYNDTIPTLSTALPGYGYRVQVVGGSLAESGVALTIRIAAAERFPVENYMPADEAQRVREAILAGKTILVAGSTSSGKTTLLNSLLRYIPDDLRLIVIEDTKELVVDQPNTVRLLKSKTGTDIARVTYKDIINACMRMRPDRILLGELDVDNTAPFLRLINTGHGGSMATIHADSASRAIDALVQNALLDPMKSLGGTPDHVERFIRQGIDHVIHIERASRREFRAKMEAVNE